MEKLYWKLWEVRSDPWDDIISGISKAINFTQQLVISSVPPAQENTSNIWFNKTTEELKIRITQNNCEKVSHYLVTSAGIRTLDNRIVSRLQSDQMLDRKVPQFPSKYLQKVATAG